MPSFDHFVNELPPDVGPLPRGPRTAGRSPGGPAAPSRQPKPDRPKEAKTPEIAVADTERQRPAALSLVNTRSGQIRAIDIEGVIGDLDKDGVDLLVGYVARINGIGFTASAAFRHRNPGGFGISLEVPGNISPFHLLPAQGGAFAEPWMTPLYDEYLTAQKFTEVEERRQAVHPISFPTFEEGGLALTRYVGLICNCHIPYFFNGPMTLIADFLSTFNTSFTTTTTHPWSQQLPLLTTRHATEGKAVS